jgi:hypothetical protein
VLGAHIANQRVTATPFNVMAGFIPAIHVFNVATLQRRGCPA